MNNKIVIEPEGLLTLEGLEGVDIFPLAEVFMAKREVGTVKLLHAGGEINAPASASMVATAKRYKNGTKLKIKGHEFVTSCATIYLTTNGKWSMEVCINPKQQQGDQCHCVYVVSLGYDNGEGNW